MKPKYRNKKTVIDGFTFDSKAEALRYQELLILQRAGHISNLELQTEFLLIPAQKLISGKTERACKYKADFVYTQNGNNVVEDVKGMKKGTAYALFVIKRKLMLEKHGIEIKEI